MSLFLKKYALTTLMLLMLSACTSANTINTQPIAEPNHHQFTRQNVTNLQSNVPACLSALKKTDLDFLVEARKTHKQCAIENLITLNQSRYKYTNAVKGQCPLITALSHWENHVIAPAAARHLKSPVDQVIQLSSFACRRIRGVGKLSEHGKANAIDVAGFILKDGTRITMLDDWGKNTSEGRFLADVHKGSCATFMIVLSPDYNAAHRDHLHLDLAPQKYCR